MIALLAFLLLALGVSFLCSLLEASLLSMPPSFVRQQELQGHRKGKLLGRMKREIDRPLAAILSLNTVAHTVGAAGVGSQAVAIFGPAYFGIISAVLTILILLLSEIIPKTLGAQHWRAMSGFTAYTCRTIIVGTYPLVWLSEHITKLLQSRATRERSVSRDELIALAQLGASEGVLADKETRIIRNLIRFQRLKVETIMTPRTVMGVLADTTTCKDAIARSRIMRFSRILLCSDTNDNIVGYALKSEILQRVAFGKGDDSLAELVRPMRFVLEVDSLSKLFDELVTHNEQIALVVDEYGATTGLVTMEDLFETLLGLEIVDESDHEVDMRALARQRWTDRARKMGIIEQGPGQ